MSGVIEDLSEDERYLFALLSDPSGLDLAEFTWLDQEQEDNCWRAWPYQWRWFKDQSPLSIDQCGRSVGKSLSIKMRMFAFPFLHPGAEAVVTAPELVHLNPIIGLIENQFKSTRLGREMLPKGKNQGITHRPFECIAEGQLVLTERGFVPIENVVVGDRVLTHKGRWRPVVATRCMGEREVVRLQGMGHPGLIMTPDHRLWARNRKQKETFKSGQRAMERVLDVPQWIAPSEWRVKDPATMWSSPAVIDAVQLPTIQFRMNKQGFGVGYGAQIEVLSPEFLWFLGHYLAEGCVWRKQLTVLTVHEKEVATVVANLNVLGVTSYSRPVAGSKAVNIRISNAALASWIDEFCPGDAYTKQVPVWVYSLDEKLRLAFMEGYLYGDGHLTKLGHQSPGSASKALAFGIRLLASTLCWSSSVYYRGPKTNVVRGRTIEQGEFWPIHINAQENLTHRHVVFDEGLAWSAATRISDAGKAVVYDLTVEEDHSFVVEGIVVSNCDFRNGARIMGRIPQRDGKGIKGCEIAGTLVLTKRGLVPIEDVVVGDEVWTHRNRWRPVSQVFEFKVDSVAKVSGAGHQEKVTSDIHRFYARRNKNPQRTRNLEAPSWVSVANPEIDKRWYWGAPAKLEDSAALDSPFDTDPESFLWIVGRYLADGYLGKNAAGDYTRVIMTVHSDKAQAVLDMYRKVLPSECTPARVKTRGGNRDNVELYNRALAQWLLNECGRLAGGKHLPAVAFSLPQGLKQALLDGYLHGDGHFDLKRERWTFGSASKPLAMGLKLLAQSIGWSTGFHWVDPQVDEICGVKLRKECQRSWRVTMTAPNRGRLLLDNDMWWGKIRSVEIIDEPTTVYDLSVEEDHSYIADGIVSHNTHPLWLEMDEAQDYPDPGWLEIIETLKRGSEGAMWRAHGVTRGVRDYFFKFTQPESGWRVHRYTAMHRPTWSEQERKEKMDMYGSKDHPDYRRNVLGLHGDATNPLFVLHRLMQCVDSNQSSEYNQDVYQYYRVNHEMLVDMGVDIAHFLQFPASHKKHKVVWVGMDVGYTNHPSEILVFAEETPKGKPSRLVLLTRIHLERVSHVDQVACILHVIDEYKPKAFAMDKTGLGLPLFQDIQAKAPRYANMIKGYNFSSKVVVDFDTTVELDEFRGDITKDAAIEKNVLEASSDKLRELVDEKRLLLPWDTDLLGEFQGQTYKVIRDTMNLYGKKEYSQGKFHALDAARMAVLGWSQEAIEKMMVTEKHSPVTPMFLSI